MLTKIDAGKRRSAAMVGTRGTPPGESGQRM